MFTKRRADQDSPKRIGRVWGAKPRTQSEVLRTGKAVGCVASSHSLKHSERPPGVPVWREGQQSGLPVREFHHGQGCPEGWMQPAGAAIKTRKATNAEHVWRPAKQVRMPALAARSEFLR
ncbi:hypothetical protein [Hydromonas duriensis]|uniref:hypothetical protein n=1 Tax=Hydromonas duriensis TaxID=1527608 RepID=UPI00106221D1|nr:hypothetical protein [Hydromonas duriensis]